MTPDCVVISHSVTIPEYRGKGLYPAILKEVIHELADQGFKRFYIDCADWNRPSNRVIERIGFSLIGRGKCKRKGRLAWYQESPPDFTQVNNKEQLI
jgi:RimJ/RimL family protein N-acetyltransferase